jgi:glycosyltransferase involved in cell wall biosynthesis
MRRLLERGRRQLSKGTGSFRAGLRGALARLRELWQLHGLGSRVRALRKLELDSGLGYDIVLFCPNYPDMTGTRGNGGEFVRTRVGAYVRHGLSVLVVEVTRLNRGVVLEQQHGHACLRIAPLALEELLRCLADSYRAVVVHTLTPQLGALLARVVDAQKVAYFFHGAEIRDYRRLHFNHGTQDMELQRHARDTTHFARMAAARNIIRDGRSPMVFVSNYLRTVAERDTGLPIPQAHVIPNFIDVDFYRYRAKDVTLAQRVLLIRSFEAANYAADIAVSAILELLATPLGATLRFTVCGFGRYFRALTAPLAAYDNVVVREGYLPREEIRALHEHHGIFLAPSRHDTQGVTMCEAMASGLVPVTHAIGGIPEYVDATCGELARDHTPGEFARCIARVAGDAEVFLRKSAAAAAQMRERCAVAATIERELALIAQCASTSARPSGPRVLHMADVTLPASLGDEPPVTLTRSAEALTVTAPGLHFQLALPAITSCRYAYVQGDEARHWLAVARALGRRFAAGSLFVLRADDPLLPLAMMMKKHFAIDYLLWDLNAASASGVRACALLGSARAVSLAPGVERATIESKFVAPLRVLGAPSEIPALIAEPQAVPVAEATTASDARPMRVLLVAYFAGPCPTVGVARPNYWFEQFDRLSNGRTETHLVTAVRPPHPSARLHHVPDLHGITLTEANDVRSKWVSEFVATEARRAKQVNTLGYFWRIALERYFAASDLHFDAVIISGNPFAYFDFASFARARWSSRVVLDYRDPFALNPVMNYDANARETATYIEAGYNFQADLILAVNNECVARIVGHEEHPTAVVANGYDERIAAEVVPVALNKQRINLIHAGALNHYRSLDELLEVLDGGRHCLHHVGTPPPLAQGVQERDVLVLHGRQSYRETLALIAGADCGIVFLSDSGFESTTKVFDYLCFDLDVLVISPDATPRGPLADIGTAGGKLHWVRNTRADLTAFLTDYVPSARRAEAGQVYSRAASTQRLLELLEVGDEGRDEGQPSSRAAACSP